MAHACMKMRMHYIVRPTPSSCRALHQAGCWVDARGCFGTVYNELLQTLLTDSVFCFVSFALRNMLQEQAGACD